MLVKGKNPSLDGIKRILLIQLGDIGDVVLTFPSIKALHENFPQANLIIAVREKARELIEDCPWATGVISINKDKRRLAQEIAYQKDFFLRLRKYNFDLAIDMRRGTRGAILAFLSGARQRIGFYTNEGRLWRDWAFTHLVSPEERPGQYVAERYFNLLATYNIRTENIWPELVIPQEKQQRAAALFRKENIPSARPVIAVQPFSLWQYKEWGREKYIQMIDRIQSKYDLSIIITGSADERYWASEIVKKCKQNVYNFAGKTAIGMLAAVLKACNLFIGGDSAGMHISSAVGTPTISIFGPTSSADWAPRGPQHCIVQKDLICVPCHQKGCQGSEISRCLKELTVDEVMSAVNGRIDRILNS